MKVGIFTFHCAHNYGAVLQAYALQEFLCSKGFEAYIIDYCPPYLIRPYNALNLFDFSSRNFISFLRIFISKLFLLPVAIKRSKAFNHFIRRYLKVTSLDLASSNPDFDVFVFGSDQIWNPKICRGFDDVYFGKFKAAQGKGLISYAASMGTTVINEDGKEYLRWALADFSAVSVREYSLQHFLSEWQDKSVKVVMDPTFLLDVKRWDKIIQRTKIEGKYVLVYQVKTNPETLRIANCIARQIGGLVVELKAFLSLTHRSKYQCASPETFLSCIKYASCVVTTSFHGTAFSLIFNRPFYTIRLNADVDARSESLLGKLDLLDRLLDSNVSPVFSEIDYQDVNLKRQRLTNESERFLLEALEKFVS